MGLGRGGAPPWPTTLTAIAVIVVLVAGIVAAVRFEPRFPEEWDPRVADLAAFVAGERGLEFHYPVFVDFLDPEEFRRAVTGDEAELTETEVADLEQGAAFLRATGLASGPLDIFDSLNQLAGESTLAYYDPAEERITVRGTHLSVGIEATLVHELTHVLQDQNFDLQRLETFTSDGERNAFRAVVEGDALRVEEEWAAQLGRRDRQTLDHERVGEAAGVELPEELPGALLALFSAPYSLGLPFVEAVFAELATDGVDAALRDPPRSEEQLLDPFVYLDGNAPQPVDLPPVGEGETLLEEGDFGALTWFLLLAEHLDPRQALRATDGWGGDSYVAFEHDGRACLRAAFRGDDPAETDQMAAVLAEWTAAVPANDATVSRRDGEVVLESCDPGAGAEGAPGGGAQDALIYPVSRTYATLTAISGGVGVEHARCLGTEIVLAYSIDELLAFDEILADPAILAERSQQAATACR
ncbi:MAG TPA: hypothetical protein VNT56_00800 [Acidimicrobiales bacterium]|nr:hypothetical protein [Acidimicrobiales bacterium]